MVDREGRLVNADVLVATGCRDRRGSRPPAIPANREAEVLAIASPNLPAEELAHIQRYFLSLDLTEEGQRRLAKLGYKGFASYDERALLAIGEWLGASP